MRGPLSRWGMQRIDETMTAYPRTRVNIDSGEDTIRSLWFNLLLPGMVVNDTKFLTYLISMVLCAHLMNFECSLLILKGDGAS